MCSSYLLTGSQDGHIRAYDPWSSANGMQTMTAQQRSVVGLGESINKAGVFRGWWNNEVESGSGEDAWKGLEPVYSLACQSDALWAASGTRVGCSLLGRWELMISLDPSICIPYGTRRGIWSIHSEDIRVWSLAYQSYQASKSCLVVHGMVQYV
jgi:hypothetical protein